MNNNEQITYGKNCIWNPDIVIERFREEAKLYGSKWAREQASNRFMNCENPRIAQIVNSWEMPRVNDAANMWARAAAGEFITA